LKRLLLASILSLPLPQVIQAKETINWVKWKLVPEYIDSAPYKDMGYLDNFLKYTLKRLPEYNHKQEYSPINRIAESWKNGNVCSLHLWLGYWPKKIIYSKPYAFTPRFGIIVRKDSKIFKHLGTRKSVSLKYLLSETNYAMGILPLFYRTGTNSRYPQLKHLIKPYIGTKKVEEFKNSRNEMSVAYLDSSRVDYILRMRITHYAETKIKSINPNKYQHYYLDEGMTYKKVAAACSKSKLGKEVITKINKFIEQDYDFFNKYIYFRQQWDTHNTVFEENYKNYFIKKIPNTKITK